MPTPILATSHGASRSNHLGPRLPSVEPSDGLFAVDQAIDLVALLVDEPHQPVAEVAAQRHDDEHRRTRDGERDAEDAHRAVAREVEIALGALRRDPADERERDTRDHRRNRESHPDALGVRLAAGDLEMLDLRLEMLEER